MLAAWISTRALALGLSSVVAPVSWEAPQECPSAEAFESALEEKIGQPLSAIDAAIRVIVVVEPAEPGYTVRLWWVVPDEPTGSRRFEAESCATAVEAAAEVVALATAEREEIPAPPPQDPQPELVPVPVPVPAPAPAVKKKDRIPLWFGIAALGGVGLGETPQAAGIVRGRLSLIGRRFRVDAQGHYRFVRRAELDGEQGVRVTGWSVGPRACTVPRLGPIEFPVCGEVMVGQLLGRPYGLTAERRTRSLWANAGLGVGAWWPGDGARGDRGRRAGLRRVPSPGIRHVGGHRDRARRPGRVRLRGRDRGALRGQAMSVETLYREHHRFVWRSLRRMGVPTDGLEDALQEVFIVAARRHGEFEGRSSVKTWLFSIGPGRGPQRAARPLPAAPPHRRHRVVSGRVPPPPLSGPRLVWS